MLMSWIWILFLAGSILSAACTGQAASLAPAILEGAQSGIALAISLGGSLCLWSGAGKLMEAAGVTALLSRLLHPMLQFLFPTAKTDEQAARYLCGNFCANLLGLGNAATPMGIQAARRLKRGDAATDELCRLIVLNSASIQLLPTTVAAVRASLGSAAPFDILPAVWLTSFCSAGVGLLAAWLFGKVWKP